MICDECETVAHCLKNGCVPKQPSKDEALELALDWYDSGHEDREEFQAMIENLLAAPVQQSRSDVEPVAIRQAFVDGAWHDLDKSSKWHGVPNRTIYTTPPNVATPLAAQRQWVGLDDADLAVCGDEDDVLLARYWERVCKEKNT
jgi:hypothetical protein